MLGQKTSPLQPKESGYEQKQSSSGWTRPKSNTTWTRPNLGSTPSGSSIRRRSDACSLPPKPQHRRGLSIGPLSTRSQMPYLPQAVSPQHVRRLQPYQGTMT
eukprot:342001_1